MMDKGLAIQSGGRIAHIERFPGNDPHLFATSGDGLARLTWRRSSISTAPRKDRPGHGGEAPVPLRALEITDGGEVESSCEKPTAKGWVSTGFFIFDRRLFGYLGTGEGVLEAGPVE